MGLTGADSVFGDVAESVEGLVIVPAGVLCVGDVVEESLLFDTIAIMMNRPISARSPNRAFLPAGVTPVDEAGIGGFYKRGCQEKTLLLTCRGKIFF